MKLPLKVTSLETLEEKYHDLYEKQDDGSFKFVGVDGIKTQEDVDKLQNALHKERNDHAGSKEALRVYRDIGAPDHLADVIARIPVLEEAAKGKVDETKINDMVEQRIGAKTEPLKRQITEQARLLDEAEGKIRNFEIQGVRRTIADVTRAACAEMKVRSDAIGDVVMIAENIFEVTDDNAILTKEGCGCTQGISPKVWLTDMQSVRPYWWGDSMGAGASGSGGGAKYRGQENPWTRKHWNMTKQAAILVENETIAEQMARAAGTTIGGPKPTA